MKKFSIERILIFMAMPLLLDIVAIILALIGMAGGSYSEGLISILFQIANWPSILFRLSPPDYLYAKLFDALYPKILIFNIITWGVVGVLSDVLIRKNREKNSLTENRNDEN